MPRRDAISEKKRERLALEHAQLQQLMLHARSSMRRSSMNAKTSLENDEVTEELPEATSQQPQSDQQFYPVFNTEIDAENTPQQNETFDETMPSPEQREWEIVSKRGRSVIINHPDTSFENVNAAVPAWDFEKVGPEPVPEFDTADSDEPDVFEKFIPDARSRRQPSRTALWLGSGLLAVIIGSAVYYFTLNKELTGTPAAQSNSEVTQPLPSTTPITEAPAAIDDTARTNQNTVTPSQAKKINPPVVASKPTPVTVNNTAKSTAPTTTKLGTFTVVSKAYFHDAPDEATRRKAFIVHWNNAVLKPTDERNGFYYIVFTNHLGQTSKGWLRKKDLRPLN